VQPEVDGMTASKAQEMFPRWLGLKRIIISQEIIANETNDISRCIGYGGCCDKKQEIVDAIMKC